MAKTWATLGALVVVSAAQTDAQACLHSMQRSNPAIATLGEAQRLVEGGNPKDAVRWVYASSPSFMKDKPGESAVSDLALSILARAAVRSDGASHLGHATEAPSAEERRAALLWASAVSRSFHDAKPDDPGATTHLAEALARIPKDHAEAIRLSRAARESRRPAERLRATRR